MSFWTVLLLKEILAVFEYRSKHSKARQLLFEYGQGCQRIVKAQTCNSRFSSEAICLNMWTWAIQDNFSGTAVQCVQCSWAAKPVWRNGLDRVPYRFVTTLILCSICTVLYTFNLFVCLPSCQNCRKNDWLTSFISEWRNRQVLCNVQKYSILCFSFCWFLHSALKPKVNIDFFIYVCVQYQ